jgi:FkbM family methyltransferase
MNNNINIVKLLINKTVTENITVAENTIDTENKTENITENKTENTTVTENKTDTENKTENNTDTENKTENNTDTENKTDTENITENSVQKLKQLHEKLKLNYGNFREEYPEQLMSALYIKPDNIVLELGGNIGRNSCIIASLLNNSNNLVVFESDPDNASKLKENCDLNNLNFIIEDCAISKTELLQKDWITKTKDLIKDNELANWKPIKTMSWLQIKNKYKITFDTLVADCEGALYYILKDEPDFLETFKTIIIENDFNDIEHKKFVDSEFKRFGFNNVYTKSGGFGPCYNCFFEVWIK